MVAMGRVFKALVRFRLGLLGYGVLGVVEDESYTSDSRCIDYDNQKINFISLMLCLKVLWLHSW